MSQSNLLNSLLNEDLSAGTINKLKALTKSIGFTDTIFVSSAGDNSDGSSWSKAYTSITTALDWIASNQSSGEHHLIVLGNGSFDINTTADPTYDENISIIGIGRDFSSITNSHASATSILKFTGSAGLYNLKIDTGATSINGVLVSTSGANGFEADNIYFEGDASTGAMDLLKIDGTIEYVKIKNCKFHGTAGNTTALHLDGCSQSEFKHLIIDTGTKGIHLDNAGDDNNYFDDIEIKNHTTAIQIDVAGATGNRFEKIHLHSCTTNISDAGTNTFFDEHNLVWDDRYFEMFPAGAASGITVTGAAGAETYGALATIVNSAGADITKPFKITGVVIDNASDNANLYIMQLTYGASDTVFATLSFHGAATLVLISNNITSPIFAGGTIIKAKIQTEGGGADTCDVWVQYQDI